MAAFGHSASLPAVLIREEKHGGGAGIPCDVLIEDERDFIFRGRGESSVFEVGCGLFALGVDLENILFDEGSDGFGTTARQIRQKMSYLVG